LANTGQGDAGGGNKCISRTCAFTIFKECFEQQPPIFPLANTLTLTDHGWNEKYQFVTKKLSAKRTKKSNN
jgi:hypothetical protein